jgi:hypothetical protein
VPEHDVNLVAATCAGQRGLGLPGGGCCSNGGARRR